MIDALALDEIDFDEGAKVAQDDKPVRKFEALHPDLEASLLRSRTGRERYIYNPLLITEAYSAEMNKEYNSLYRFRLMMVERAIKNRHWVGVTSWYEQPFKLDTFLHHMPEMTDIEYWQALGEVWNDTHSHYEMRRTWERLMLSDRPDRRRLMTNLERYRLDQFADELTVYRGESVDDTGHEISWTLDLNKAIYFAKRGAFIADSDPMVSVGTVKKADVIAYFSRRDQSEIISDGVEIVKHLSSPYLEIRKPERSLRRIPKEEIAADLLKKKPTLRIV